MATYQVLCHLKTCASASVRTADIHSVLVDDSKLVLTELEIPFDLVFHRGSVSCEDIENGCQLFAVDALECPKDCVTDSGSLVSVLTY